MAVNKTVEQIIFEGVDRLTAVTKKAEGSVGELKGVVNGVKDALGLIGVTVGAGAFIKLQLDALQATAALDDMSEASGASVEGLSAIQRVAKVGGHDFNGLTGQIGRMIKGLKEGSDEGNRTAFALKFLGIEARGADGAFRDTSQILVELAQKLKAYTTDGDKVRFIQDALGKGAERYLPLLKDMAEGTDLHATVTREQAEAADRAEKNINRLRVAMEDARRETVNEFTPAIVKLTDQMLAAARASGGFWAGLNQWLSVSGRQAENPVAALEEVEKRLEKLRADRAVLGGDSLGAKFNRMMAPEDLAVLDRQIAHAERQISILRELASRRLAGNTAGMVEDAAGFHPAPATARLNYNPPDTGADSKAQREANFVARQLQEGLEEEQRIQAEAGAATAAFRDKQIETDQKAAAARIAISQGIYEMEQEVLAQLIVDDERRANERLALFQQLRERFGNQEEVIEQEAHERRLEQLQRFSDEELEALGGRQALIEQMEREHQQRIIEIRRAKLAEQRTVSASGYRAQAAAVTSELADMTAGVAQHSKELFELNKLAAVATIALKTPEAIASAYAFGAKFGGPPLGAIMAGVAAAAMGVQAAAVASAKFGGGSAPSIVGSTPAPAVTPVESGAPIVSGQRVETRVVILSSTPMQRQVLEELADGFKELHKDGYPMPFTIEPA